MHDLFQVLRIQRIQYTEKVISAWPLALIVGVRKVFGEVGVLLVHRPQLPDQELIILRHLDGGDGVLLQQHLFAGEDLFQEVLVDVRLRRKEVLD